MRRSALPARLALVAALATASVAASAVQVSFASSGGYEYINGNGNADIRYTETVGAQAHLGLPDVRTYVETYLGSAVDVTDTATYTGVDPADSFTLSIDPNATATPDPTNPDLVTYASAWTYVSGTGRYAGLTGGGDYLQIDDEDAMASRTTITGNLTAVPEPTSLAALGLGTAGLFRRRKRL